MMASLIELSDIAETDSSSATINNTINVQNKDLCKKFQSTFYFFVATSQRSLSFAELFFLCAFKSWNERNWHICEI